MKPVRLGLWMALCVSTLAALPAAAEKPVNISLFTPISIAQANEGVGAFRFNFIYGKNTSVKLVDLGLVNQTTTLSHGLQWGFVNYTEGAEKGLQLGAVNYNKGSTYGLQWAGVNYAESGGGLQVAFVNYAAKMNGVQIGAINIIKSGGMFPVMIIANWGK